MEATKFAAASGSRVEIADRTTELSQTFANPDGSMTSKVSNGPVRVRRDGVWNAIDTTLEFRPDGTVGPKTSVSQITLSGGGTALVGKVGLPEGTFELKSPWTLPRPSLSGSTATYGDVLQGVDLVVDSTSEGLSYNLVVKTREAASNPALRSIRFPVATAGLSVRTNRPGGPAYLDKTGRLVMSAGDAIMWDGARPGPQGKQAAAPRTSAKQVADGPAGAHSKAMQLRGDATGLTMIPDAGLLTSPTTIYPVVLDPVIKTITRASWAAAWQLYPTTSFYKTTHSLGVGYEDYEQHKIVRSFWQFDTTLFRGKKVLSAKFRTYESHSANCTAHSVTVTRTGPISTATTWNKQPAAQLAAGSKSFAHGYSASCPDAYEEFVVTNSMVDTAAKNYTTSTFRLTATNEADGLAWKQFSSFGELEVNYATLPDIPRQLGLTDPAVGCDDASSPVNVGSKTIKFGVTPRLMGNVYEGDNVYAEIILYSTTGNSFRTLKTGLDRPGTPLSVSMASTDIPDGQLVHFRARTMYPTSAGTLASAFTIFCYFKVDRLAPPPPTVTMSYGATALQNCDGAGTTCPAVPPLGAALSLVIKANASDVVRQEYWFQGASSRASGAGGTITKAVVPPQEGFNRIHVQSFDGANHGSEVADFVVNVKGASPPTADWSFDEGSGTTAGDKATPAHPLTLAGGAAFDDAGRSGGSLQLDGVDDYAQTSATSMIDTSKSFTVSAWARLTTTKEAVVVGAAGNISSAFELYYSLPLNRWVFVRMKTDTMSPVSVKAVSNQPAVLGAWTHLTGVYDQGQGFIQLYVNGRLQTSGDVPFADSAWKATGPLSIGQGQYNDVFTNRFPGSVDSVQLWQRAFLPDGAMALADPRVDDRVVTGLAARWPLDTATLGSDQVWRTDESVYGASMPISGFGSTPDQSAAFVEDDDRGRVLEFAGTSGEMLSLPSAVLDGGTSFSAGVWVKLADPDKPAVIARQAGADRDAWRLEWQPVDEISGRWVFSRARADSDVEDVAVYPAPKDAVADQWRLLIGSYDAASPDQINSGALGSISLTADKAATEGGESRHPVPYRIGTPVVGKGRAAGTEFAGRIDDLRLYTGALDDRATCEQYPDLGQSICPQSTEG